MTLQKFLAGKITNVYSLGAGDVRFISHWEDLKADLTVPVLTIQNNTCTFFNSQKC